MCWGPSLPLSQSQSQTLPGTSLSPGCEPDSHPFTQVLAATQLPPYGKNLLPVVLSHPEGSLRELRNIVFLLKYSLPLNITIPGRVSQSSDNRFANPNLTQGQAPLCVMRPKRLIRSNIPSPGARQGMTESWDGIAVLPREYTEWKVF